MIKTDTIAAIATAMSDSGIGIIRISGEDALSIADKIFYGNKGNKKLIHVESHTIHYGHIVDNFIKNKEKSESYKRNADNAGIEDMNTQGDKIHVIDEVMVTVMRAPRSYTMENVVEINCHGGVLLLNRVLKLVLAAGARLAEPGEFTKRAFLNGRIDLSKAEAVIDIIHSKNQFALSASVSQLKGSVSKVIRRLRESILYETAFIESALDDPEHISLEGYTDRLKDKAVHLMKEMKQLSDSSENGKLLKEGINTVIVGKPNAGKSSFLNLLVGEDKAIVTSVAGTTRDILEEYITVNGIGLNIIDTAGIRSTEDIVEKIGVEKARKYAASADLIIYVADSSIPLDESDMDIMEMIKDKKCIVLLNKTDLPPVVTEKVLEDAFSETSGQADNTLRIIRTSTKDEVGIDLFEEAVKTMFFHGEISFNDEIIITNMRHKAALSDAYESLMLVCKSLEENMPEDFLSIDLMSAYKALGSITGEEVGEDLVSEIFSKFCMGK